MVITMTTMSVTKNRFIPFLRRIHDRRTAAKNQRRSISARSVFQLKICKMSETMEEPAKSAAASDYEGDFRTDNIFPDSPKADSPESDHLGDVRIEKTLAMIKPEAVKFETDIENIILENGFTIIAKRTVRLTPEQVAEFYVEHYGQTYFPNLIIYMANNPIVALCIAKPNAVKDWIKLMGPTNVLEAQAYWPKCVRACYGLEADDEGEYYNAVHGSDGHAAAVREIHFFFPNISVGPMLRGWQVTEYIQGNVNPVLQEGLQELCKEKPIDPIVWLADWLLTHNPNTAMVTLPQETIECANNDLAEY